MFETVCCAYQLTLIGSSKSTAQMPKVVFEIELEHGYDKIYQATNHALALLGEHSNQCGGRVYLNSNPEAWDETVGLTDVVRVVASETEIKAEMKAEADRKRRREEIWGPEEIDSSSSEVEEAADQQMEITISSMSCTFTIGVKSSDTIFNVKTKIQDKVGIPISVQKLRDQPIEGVELHDGKTLSDYNVFNNGTVFLNTAPTLSWIGQSSSSSGGAG